MNDICKRLIEVKTQVLNDNASELCRVMGVKTVHEYLRGNRVPNGESLQRLLIAYPELSPSWLMLGKGEMLLNENQPTISQTNVNGDNIGTVISDESEVSFKSNTSSSDLQALQTRHRDLVNEHNWLRQQFIELQALNRQLQQSNTQLVQLLHSHCKTPQD